MALPKRSLPKPKVEKEKKVPKLCYCKNCVKGTKTENFMVWCSAKGYWQHSIVNCLTYKEKW